MKKHILSLALILVTSTSAMAQSVDYFVGTDARITCDGDGEADQVVLDMATDGGGQSKFKESIRVSGVRLRKKLMELLNDKNISGTTFREEMDDYVKQAVCFTKVVTEEKVAAGFDARFKKTLTMIETQLEKNNKDTLTGEDAVTNSEKSMAYANEILFANRGAVAFIVTTFENY